MYDRLADTEIRAEANPQEEQSEFLLPAIESSHSSKRHGRHQLYPCFIAFLLLMSSGFAAFLGAQYGGRWHPASDALCAEHTSQYSPIQKDVDISYDVIRFNGSLLKENVYRREGGPEVDAAWASLGVHYTGVTIPPEEAKRSGLLPDQVQIAEKYGGGFPANVEGLHHLHCLNLLRQSLYYNYEHYHALGEGAFTNSDDIVKYHVSHCLDILRQQLMCTVDTGVLGQVWWNPKQPQAYVDFNTRHKCKNFDAVRQWAKDHQLPRNVPADFLQPPKAGDRIYEEIP